MFSFILNNLKFQQDHIVFYLAKLNYLYFFKLYKQLSPKCSVPLVRALGVNLWVRIFKIKSSFNNNFVLYSLVSQNLHVYTTNPSFTRSFCKASSKEIAVTWRSLIIAENNGIRVITNVFPVMNLHEF